MHIYTGCMFSGKTENLIRELERAKIRGEEVLVFKPGIDNRHGDRYIGSHSGSRRSSKIVESGNESEIIDRFDDHDAVFIDDANLLSGNIISVVEELLEMGVDVYVSATDKDFKGDPFNPVPKLLALADFVDKLDAVCEVCGGRATMSQRLVDGEPASKDDDVILIDSKETYEPRCRDCHVVQEKDNEEKSGEASGENSIEL